MVRPDREPLAGRVEVDEAYVGGRETGRTGRGAVTNKSIVTCAAERDADGIGRIRMAVVQNASGPELHGFVKWNVEEGSVALTDGWLGYSGLGEIGYEHIATAVAGSGLKAHDVLPAPHLVFALLKRWALGTYHGSMSAKHLQWYLEEFTFRFNRRSARSITHRFQRLFEGAVRQRCRTYREIVQPVPA
jgi:transposase-like protein